MGSRAHIPSAGSLGLRKSHDSDVFGKVNQVQVVDVNLEDGTIQVSFLNVAIESTCVIPLLGLSLPPDKTNSKTRDYTSAGWGRYIPQVGDILLAAYGTDGTLHAFGYSTSYYASYEVTDQATESKGGIGWGPTSGKNLKPGDWDFKSARGCLFYMGDKINLSSSNCSLSISQDTQDMTGTAPLIINTASASSQKYGAVRRQVMPTDRAESYIYIAEDSSNPARLGSVAQEFKVDLKWGSGSTTQPPGGSLAYLAIGDVVDDLNPNVSVAGYDLMQGDSAPIRYFFHLPNAADPTDTLKTFVETVDGYGNYEVQSNTATLFKWNTPLAAWEVSNLSTSLESVTSMTLEAATMELSSTLGMTISSNTTATLDGVLKAVISSDTLVNLGKDGVKDGLIKGTTWLSLMLELFGLLATHIHPTAVGPTGTAPALIGMIPLTLTPKLTNVISTKVFTE